MPATLLRSTARNLAAAVGAALLVAAPRGAAAQFSLFSFDYTALACAGAGCTPGTSAFSFAGGAMTLTPWGAASATAAWWNSDGRPLVKPSFPFLTFSFQDLDASYDVAATPVTVQLKFAPNAGVGDVFLHAVLTASAGPTSGSGTLDFDDAPITIDYGTPVGFGSYTSYEPFDGGFYYARGHQGSGYSTLQLDIARASDITPGNRPPAVTAAPEPAAVALLGFGLVTLGVVRRRRTQG